MFDRRVWVKEARSDFLMKTGTLLEQGYALEQALQLLSWEQPYHIKEKILRMTEELRTGTGFHEVLHDHGFPADVAAYIFFSEQGGFLSEGLKGAGDLYQKRIKARGSVQKLLRYPLVLMWVLFMIAVVMVNYLFPSFRQLFQSLDMDFPVLTRIMLQLFQYAPFAAVMLIPLLLAGFIYYMRRFRHFTPHRQYASLYRLPWIGSYLKLFLTYYFSLQFSSMLKGGVSIYEVCLVFEKQHHFPFFQLEGADLKQKLKEGKTLYDAVEESGWYRSDMKYVIQHGQVSGRLAEDLTFYSGRMLEVLEERVNKTVMVLQPVLFLIIGLVILGMFLSVFLPMFQLMNSMQ
ncbi:competence type IV pilus assembly protein ComGB [Salibacterium halotolerans]|uniref:Competence protein ComGB n=1 Tax=Salibacterium halotolerans TaxID=1884432 RepID=A0A1I5NKV0_9BACI|nr:competence type IV pilus assembly protein ComGB [Salibacterium halotolerans]SFP22347.1 competence protein ComGB [Salibacterium halotolerans]